MYLHVSRQRLATKLLEQSFAWGYRGLPLKQGENKDKEKKEGTEGLSGPNTAEFTLLN